MRRGGRRSAAAVLAGAYVLAISGFAALLAPAGVAAAAGTTINAYSDCGGSGVGAGGALVDALEAAQDGNAQRECKGLGSSLTGPYTIVLDPAYTYALTAPNNYSDGPDGLPAIIDQVTIESSSTSQDAVIERSTATRAIPSFRLFDVAGSGAQYQPVRDVTYGTTSTRTPAGNPLAGSLTLARIEVTGGLAEGGNGADCGGGGAGLGGAIFSHGGSVTLVASLLEGNAAEGGDAGASLGAGGGGGVGGSGGTGEQGGGGGGGGGTEGDGAAGTAGGAGAGGGPNGGTAGGGKGGYDGGSGGGVASGASSGGFGGGGGGAYFDGAGNGGFGGGGGCFAGSGGFGGGGGGGGHGGFGGFRDDAAIDGWALQGVEAAVAAGYIRGFPDGSLRPLGTTTRAQAAKVLARVLRRSGTWPRPLTSIGHGFAGEAGPCRRLRCSRRLDPAARSPSTALQACSSRDCMASLRGGALPRQPRVTGGNVRPCPAGLLARQMHGQPGGWSAAWARPPKPAVAPLGHGWHRHLVSLYPLSRPRAGPAVPAPKSASEVTFRR